VSSFRLHRVLVFGEEFDSRLDTRTQILHLGCVRAGLYELQFEAGHQQVKSVGVFVAANAAQVLEWGCDGQ
jgi:hypothetical protein